MTILKTAFECEREGLKIRGKAFYEENGKKLPAVIISHGFMSNQTSVESYAETLAESGSATFIFDFCGGGIKCSSDGKSEDMTVFTEAKDLNAVIDYVAARSFVDKNNITLMGCSQGGFVSGMVAAERGKEIKSLVLFYPALCIPDDARKGQMLGFKFDPNNMPEILSKFPMKIGREYAACVLEKDAVDMIKGYDGEVLIVHGTADRIVDISYAERAYKAFGENRCRLLRIQGGGHGFKGNADKVAIGAAKEFLSGREEVFAVDVRLTGRTIERKGLYSKLTLPFDGSASGRYFSGTIEKGAADVQERRGLKIIQCKADYVISGTDANGERAKVHVVNVDTGGGWKPTVTATSKALEFLNEADCTAYLEQRKTGPIVHIYTTIPKR